MQVTEIARAVNGRFISQTADSEVSHLLIDSRNVFSGEETLFLAIKGERHDGHDYLSALYRQGIRNFIVSTVPSKTDELKDANIILVEDSVQALQQLAAFHRSRFDIPVIGITGSNGKTVVKEWLWQLLGPEKNVVRSPKSFNSQVGVPLSVWQMNERHEVAIFEAGISRPGEMERLEKVLKPTIGIITNAREAHIENFKDKQELAAEKLTLFAHCKAIIYCADYDEIRGEIEKDTYSGMEKLGWSAEDQADVQLLAVHSGKKGSEITVKYREEQYVFSIPFTDHASVENAMHCWMALHYLGYEADLIARRMQQLSSVAMRLEVKEGINHSILVNDSYNSDLYSLSVALDFLNQQKPENRKTLILSDIYQSGKDDRLLYASVARLIEMKKIDRLIGIGERISACSELFNLDKSFYPDTAAFMAQFQENRYQRESILVKGARNFEFEKITERLQQKAHETVLEVNLNALIGNYNYFKSLLRPETRLMVMVKAASYGVGSIEVASALQHNRVDYLGVAYADEGIQLRNGGITLPIMVMNPEPSAFDAMIRYDLQPELYNFRTLELFREALRSNQYYLDNGRPFPIHIKLDTGMRRLGFDETDFGRLLDFLADHQHSMVVKTVFSHLASSDDPHKDAFSTAQIERFKGMSDAMMKRLGYPVDRHMLNSNGILRFPDAQFEMVRLGIGLYGIVSDTRHQRKLRSVSRLKTIVSQLRETKKGDTIGYDQRHVMDHDGQIATIPVGYADGLNRKLGNGHWKVLINGHRAPVVGSICMDMCMVDVTGMEVKEGDAVIVFDGKDDLKSMAEILGTIPYEIFTSISGRVKRVYYDE